MVLTPALASSGSSPRMRGARGVANLPPLHARIIPADAGSTTGGSRDCSPARDHPRGCGEHGCRPGGVVLDPGSSPRMRGALREQITGTTRDRIIPADAGSTRPAWDASR